MSLNDPMLFLTTFWNRVSNVLNQERVLRNLATVTFAIVFCVVCLSINRGIGLRDESWYLVLLRDQVAIGGSAWPLFYSWLPDNLLVIRMVTVGLELAGSFFLGYGIYSYFKIQFNLSYNSIVPLMIFGFIVTFCSGATAICLVPFYAYSNHFIFAVGIGSALLCAKSEKVGIWWAWLSGFVMGFLLFIMPTNMPIILVVAIFIILKPNPWQRLIAFTVGLVFAILIFFLLIQSPPDFYMMIKQAMEATSENSSTHGIKQMISWMIATTHYIVSNILMVAALIYLLRRQMDKISIMREPLLLLVCLLIIVSFLIPYLLGFVNYNGVFQGYIWAILFVWFILEARQELTLMDKYALALFFVSPIFASLGTDVAFSGRGSFYMGIFYGSGALLFVLSPYCARLRAYVCLVLLLLTFGFVIHFYRPNWEGESLSKNIINISEIGIQKGIRITPQMISMINQARNFIGESRNVVVGSPEAWGFVYLLDLQALMYIFKPSESQIIQKINGSGMRDLIFIESSQELFSASFWSEINTKWKVDNVREIEGQFKFYRLIPVLRTLSQRNSKGEHSQDFSFSPSL